MTRLDKRTERSLNFKNFLQLQHHPQTIKCCDVFPQPRFDFDLADPSARNIYEQLKSIWLFLDAVHSPIRSSLLNTIQNYEEFVASSTYNFATVVGISIKYQLAVPIVSSAPSTVPPPSPSPATPSANSHSSITSVSPSFADDALFSLLEFSASQFDSHCLHLENQIQLCESVSSLKAQLADCEQHNLLLGTLSSTCKADHLRLENLLSTCQAENIRLRADIAPPSKPTSVPDSQEHYPQNPFAPRSAPRSPTKSSPVPLRPPVDASTGYHGSPPRPLFSGDVYYPYY